MCATFLDGMAWHGTARRGLDATTKAAEEPNGPIIYGVRDAHGHGADHTQQADIYGRPPGARGRRVKVRTQVLMN